MTFSAIVPFGGFTGWVFLNRTGEAQREAFAASGQVEREVDQFRADFASLDTPEALVNNRAALSVALGAFGLQDDIDNRFFIQRILDEGTQAPDALANLLSDTRYTELATAFDFSNPDIRSEAFMDRITSAYLEQSFEVSVGNQNEEFRLALNLQRTFGELADRPVSEDTKWFSIMGNPPLRKVFETALNLPSSFGGLPIDDQLNILKDRSASAFGTDNVSELGTAEKQEEIVQRFLLQAQVAQSVTASSGSVALQLLQASNTGRLF